MNMPRMPWSKPEPDPEPEGSGLYDEEPEEEQIGDDDPLADLDDDTRALVEEHTERVRQQERQQARASLQKAGLDLTEDYRLVGDPTKMPAWGQQPAAQPQGAAPQQPAATEDEEWPDRMYDEVGYNKRLEREIEKRVESRTKQMQEQMAGTLQTAQQMLMDQAESQVAAALQQHAPYMLDVTQHPGFAEAFRNGLAQTQPQQWRDPKFLAMIAGAVGTQLDPAQIPARPRGTDGRFTEVRQQQQRSPQNFAALSPSGGGRPAAGRQYTDDDRRFAERAGISLEEAAAAADNTGQALAAAWDKKSKGRR